MGSADKVKENGRIDTVKKDRGANKEDGCQAREVEEKLVKINLLLLAAKTNEIEFLQ